MAQQLIRQPTVNPPGNERLIARPIASMLEDAGFSVDFLDHGAGRASLLAKKSGSGRLMPVILSGHLDTVPIGQVPWAGDPFGGGVSDGRLYGRGSADMKGGVAALVVAACRLVSAPLGGDLVVALTADEEVGALGASEMMGHPEFPVQGRLIVGEPTGMHVGIAEKGALWIDVKFVGKAAHGAYPDEGASAIAALIDSVPGVMAVADRWSRHSLLGVTTANPAMIGGGSAANMVADRAWVRMDIRTAPGRTHAELVAEIEAALADSSASGVTVEVEVVADRPAFETPEDDPLVTAALGLSASSSGEARAIGLSYYTDAAVYRRSREYPTIILGPGDPEVAHKVDEFVPVTDLERATTVYEELARTLLSSP
ncbi:MAG: M20 family metallopeptidase [Chloroflexota bacterium]